MKKFVSGLFVGAAISSAVFVPLKRSEVQTSWDLGVKSGIIEGKLFAADALQKEFGLHDAGASFKPIFSVKTTEVVSVKTNGVRTVRVIP
jgi:hypothetical protein